MLLIALNLADHEVAIQLENVPTWGYQDVRGLDSFFETDGNHLMITIPARGAMILRLITS